MLSKTLLFLSLVAQSPDLKAPADLGSEALPENLETPTPPPAPPAENLGTPPETFKDPFQETPTPAQTPAPSTTPDTALPTPAAQPNFLPPSGPAVGPNAAPPSQPAPTEAAPATALPPPSPPPPSAQPAQAVPPNNFQFPDQTKEEQQVPVSKDVIQAADLQRVTEMGTVSFEGALGGAFNLNNQYNQVGMHLRMNYRLRTNWEVGLITTYRAVHIVQWGVMGTVQYAWRFTKPPRIRMDLLMGGGLGYTLVAPHNKFTYGMITLRGDTTLLVYAWNHFAFAPSLGVEAFPFGWTTKGKFRNGFKKPGLPTQAVLGLGIRYEF